MVRHGLLALFVLGLLCLSGLGFAEPSAGLDRTDAATDAGTDVWGDPEDNEEADRGWTWFGMGYENRRRSSGQRADPSSDATNDHKNGQGKGSK